ncbi:PsbP-related protein [Ruminococcus sp.]|uniref:PsbP-related protein n=1 Tax=Ruminococcus sp. TaxID=41978 RepID=UPI0025D635A3|nr:PsbP-related protein [Ruminococcus sp.]
MKKILASIMALSMVFAVTGCSEKEEDSSNKAVATTTTTTAAAAEDDTTTTTTTAAEADSVADTKTETEAPADDSTADEAEGTYENNVYDSSLYSFTIDSSKWAISETSGVDCMFTYADSADDANLASASINVISMSDELLNGLTAADYADQIKATYDAMDGYTVTNDKEDKFAGKDAYIVDVTGEIGSVTVYLNQIIVSDNGNLIVVTYGANDSAYDKLQDEFKTILDSFEIK